MPWHWLDPFAHLASVAGKVVADAWTTAMLAVWNGGLWLVTHVLGIVDAFTTPDLSAAGPGAQVYRYTFWIAGSLALTMAMLQLGVTAVRRDGRSLARVLLGTGQFVMVWAGWLGYAVTVLAACGGLTPGADARTARRRSVGGLAPVGGVLHRRHHRRYGRHRVGVPRGVPGGRRDRSPVREHVAALRRLIDVVD